MRLYEDARRQPHSGQPGIDLIAQIIIAIWAVALVTSLGGRGNHARDESLEVRTCTEGSRGQPDSVSAGVDPRAGWQLLNRSDESQLHIHLSIGGLNAENSVKQADPPETHSWLEVNRRRASVRFVRSSIIQLQKIGGFEGEFDFVLRQVGCAAPPLALVCHHLTSRRQPHSGQPTAKSCCRSYLQCGQCPNLIAHAFRATEYRRGIQPKDDRKRMPTLADTASRIHPFQRT